MRSLLITSVLMLLIFGYKETKSKTDTLKIHGNVLEKPKEENYLSVYGSDALELKKLENSNISYSRKIHVNFNFTVAQIIWAIGHEMAMNVEDVLARRTRLLFLDAKAAIEASPFVAKIMADELKKDDVWIDEQVEKFKKVAITYTIDHYYG